MPPASIPHFLLPRGLPTARTLRTLQQQQQQQLSITSPITRQCFSSTSPVSKAKNIDKSRTLSQPDKFRPPSHPQRLVNPTRTSPSGQPINYGPRLTAEQREAQNKNNIRICFRQKGLSCIDSLQIGGFTCGLQWYSPPPLPGLSLKILLAHTKKA